MTDSYASHFGINNIPYGIASSPERPTPQCVTRIGDDVIFLSELTDHEAFKSIPAPLFSAFQQSSLNTFAALPKEIHAQVRATIQHAHQSQVTQNCTEKVENVTLHLPMQIGDFTDYSASVNHVLNAGEAVMGVRSFPPGFLKYPVGYAGRCSSIAVSPTSITRPLGQYVEDYSASERKIIFGASRALDYELEIGAVIGRPVKPGTILSAKDADEHVFGLVLVNDWSARDIQGLEMNPLGPFNGKNFGTSMSPWIVTLEALKPHVVRAPERLEPIALFMDDPQSVNYAINLEGVIRRNGASTKTCTVGFETMYWTFRHMLAHHTIGGCGLRTGDLIASGTVSGEKEHEHGCLLELTKNGKKPSRLIDGSELRYLEDGDEVVYTAVVGDGSAGVGFGECVGVVRAAHKL
jgi:fumarylacetoacetase